MKKSKIFSLLMIAFLVGPFMARAEDNHENERGKMWQADKQEMRNDWQDKKDNWKEARDEWQNSKPEHRFEMRKHLAGVFFDRFDFAGRVLQNIHDRIETWLQNARDEKGIDGDAAENYLTSAQTKIDLIKIKVAEIKSILEENVTEEADKIAKKEEIKAKLADIKELVKDAHELLKQAFQSIRSEVKDLEDDN